MPINKGDPHLAKAPPNQSRVESFQRIVKSYSINKSSFLSSVLLWVFLASKLWVEAEHNKQGKWETNLTTSKGRVI